MGLMQIVSAAARKRTGWYIYDWYSLSSVQTLRHCGEEKTSQRQILVRGELNSEIEDYSAQTG